jgi:hypothetical protein
VGFNVVDIEALFSKITLVKLHAGPVKDQLLLLKIVQLKK